MHLPGTYQHSEETKAKIGAANRGKPAWHKGKRLTVGPRQRDIVPYTCDLCGKEGERQFNRLKEPGKNFCVVCKDAYKRTGPLQNVRLPVKFTCPICEEESECQYRHWKEGKQCLSCLGRENSLKRNWDRFPPANSKILRQVRSEINTELAGYLRGATRSKKTGAYAYLGKDQVAFIQRMEGLFETGMTWENHGEWHIDHIKPVSLFVKEGVTDISIVNAITNLQPLWATDNHKKHATYTEPKTL